jgi:membrane protein
MIKPGRPNPVLLAGLAIVGLLLPRPAGRPAPATKAAPPRRAGTAEGEGDAAEKTAPPADPEAARAGVHAESPHEIPPKGWWEVAKRAGRSFSEDRIMAEAASVTFYGLLALFPAIASLISIYGLFTDPTHLTDQLSGLNGVVPGGGMDIIKSQVTALTSSGHKALGFGVIVGLATSLWSANAGMKSLFDALNVVYHEHEKRSFVRLTFVSLTFTLGAVAFLILALLAVVALPIALNFVGLGSATETLLVVARWPVMLLVLTAALCMIYRYGPSRNTARWQWVSWGGGVAAVGWLLASAGFSFYVSHFGNYNKTYGSLGAVIGFMTWIWISSMVILMGAELNAELEQQTGRDSTVGPEKPQGHRGAFKADTKP